VDGETATEVTATIAVPDLLVSCVDVAVTVTLPAVLGAVRTPDELIVPALALQVTVEL
jgi:small basic protein